jgi:hypothetical protein
MFEFVEVWNASSSIVDVAKNYGIKPTSVMVRVRRLRAQGLPLKSLPDETRAAELSRPPKPPKPEGEAGVEPRPLGRPPKELKPKSTFNCHVQTMVTYETFGRLLAGEQALSSGRVRKIIGLGLEAEAHAEVEATETVGVAHGECLDCDALILIHRAGHTHCWCGEDWPCSSLTVEAQAAPPTPTPDLQEAPQEAHTPPTPSASVSPTFDLFGPAPEAESVS